MASLNKVMLIGNAGKDAELRYTANGFATANFSLAVNNRRRGQNGEWEDQTEWFNIVLLGDTAEKVSQYVTKGKPLYIEGRLQTRSWDNDQGVKQYRTEVIVNTLQLLGGRDDQGGGGGGGASGGGWNDQPERPRGNGGSYSGGAPRGGQGARPAGGNRGGFGGGAGPVDDIDDLPFE